MRLSSIIAPVAALIVGGSVVSFALAGGFGIRADIPRPDQDARLQKSVLVYRAMGCCATPESKIQATFEGKANGERLSLSVTKVAHVVRVPNDIPGWDDYGIERAALPAGRWVLSITVVSSRMTPLLKNGKATEKQVPMTLVKLIPFADDGTPLTQATPGAKYDRGVVSHDVALANREKTITEILNKADSPAPVLAQTTP